MPIPQFLVEVLISISQEVQDTLSKLAQPIKFLFGSWFLLKLPDVLLHIVLEYFLKPILPKLIVGVKYTVRFSSTMVRRKFSQSQFGKYIRLTKENRKDLIRSFPDITSGMSRKERRKIARSLLVENDWRSIKEPFIFIVDSAIEFVKKLPIKKP